MLRRVVVSIGEDSFDSESPIPAQLAGFVGRGWIDTDLALIHTALWTRPPAIYGFSLADTWAWMRYGAAFSATDDLRLRAEWLDLDPHQKTILSDELGVGFTTYWLAKYLGFICYADVLYVARSLLGGRRILGKASRRHGQEKSPDYLALDSGLRMSILECKGTQTSLGNLLGALESGASQKGNVTNLPLRASLAAGLYIPQWNGPGEAEIRIVDPEPNIGTSFDGIPAGNVRAAIVQIAYAKHFALIGMPSTAMYLSLTPLDELRQPPGPVNDEIASRMRGVGVVEHESTHTVTVPTEQVGETPSILHNIRFVASCGPDLLERLFGRNDIRGSLFSVVDSLRGQHYLYDREGDAVIAGSPLGFKFILRRELVQ